MKVDVFGQHGLSCKFSKGRHSRHTALNETVARGLTSGGCQSKLEPTDLSRKDQRRPDGTAFPWHSGKALAWDATVVDTLAETYLQKTSKTARAAAEMAEDKKREKYAFLSDTFHFVPLGFETLGSDAWLLVSRIGKKITDRTGEIRATDSLRQRISIGIQSGNAISILGTFPDSRELDEGFYS